MSFEGEKNCSGLEGGDQVTPRPHMVILVVSYSDDTRQALVASLDAHNVSSVACSTFLEAEEHSLHGLFHGLLVDLPSMVKAKGEEKIVAYTLVDFYPSLRVRALGSTLVPMAMPGSAKQDSSLAGFLTKTCPAFKPRIHRVHKRHPVCFFTVIRHREEDFRGFTLDISWGGMFIVHMRPERFGVGECVDVHLPQFDRNVRAEIRWIMPWGVKSAPGIGVRFLEMEEGLENMLAGILRTRKEFDRDRLSMG